jgi:hypothetical protein
MSDPRYPQLYERDERRRSRASAFGVIVTALVGAVLPIRYTGKLYLVRELQKEGVQTHNLSESCLQELTNEIIRQCKEQAEFEHRNWRSVITQHIEQVAFLIACRLQGDHVYLSAMSWPVPFVNILTRHGLLPLNEPTL